MLQLKKIYKKKKKYIKIKPQHRLSPLGVCVDIFTLWGLNKHKYYSVLYWNTWYPMGCDGIGTGGPIIFNLTHYCMKILV